MSSSTHDGLRVRNLSKEFATPAEPLVVLQEIDFDLGKGESLAILGPSGSGKSTLLHLIGTLDKPTSGTIELGGVDPFSLEERKLADYRNHQIGFVFQEHYLLQQCTLFENILLPTLATGNPAEADKARAHDLLNRVGLANRKQHHPAECSGGERQRAALARGLIMRPRLLLADEPTGNLDRQTADQVAELMLEVQSEEKTILLLATHSQPLAEKMRRTAELVDGRLKYNSRMQPPN